MGYGISLPKFETMHKSKSDRMKGAKEKHKTE
jgi:hypothetical protein